LAAIFPDHIVLIEIKSERDKLDRLEKQFEEMLKRGHDVKIVCHEKWFDADDGLHCQSWMRWSHKEHLWKYPAVSPWQFSRYAQPLTPSPYFLLDMLWAEELRDCYKLTGLTASSQKMAMGGMQRDLVEKLNGNQIRASVCACLRARRFAEADLAIPLTLKGSA
jgi:hypothetical protein